MSNTFRGNKSGSNNLMLKINDKCKSSGFNKREFLEKCSETEKLIKTKGNRGFILSNGDSCPPGVEEKNSENLLKFLRNWEKTKKYEHRNV